MIIRTAVIFFILTSLSELADDTYSSPLYGAGLFSFYTKIVTHYMAKNNTAGALNANRGRRVIPRRPRDLFCSVQERDDVKFSSRRRRSLRKVLVPPKAGEMGWVPFQENFILLAEQADISRELYPLLSCLEHYFRSLVIIVSFRFICSHFYAGK